MQFCLLCKKHNIVEVNQTEAHTVFLVKNIFKKISCLLCVVFFLVVL